MPLAKTVCAALMRAFPAHPRPDDPHLWEVFKTRGYAEGSPEHQARMRYASALATYEYEQNDATSWLRRYFFSRLTPADLQGKVLLDLGCYTGGRLAAWVERYGLRKGIGLDINPVFQQAGEEFARSRGLANVEFVTGTGEGLPFPDNSIDIIVATDVFEHVRSVEEVMRQCYRVLAPGGRLCVVFPQYYQPLEAHLGLVTRLPALHWLFDGQTISAAYVEILRERGDEAAWYYPESYPLRDWERLFSLNGMSARRFRRLVAGQPWSSASSITRPILTDGRKASQPLFRVLSACFAPLARTPYLEELFLGRVNYVLTK